MKILVRVTRSLLFKGMSYAVDETIGADPLEAQELVASGRAVLADPADGERMRAAVVEQRDRMLRALTAANRETTAAWRLLRRA